jgi:hypothetical protein
MQITVKLRLRDKHTAASRFGETGGRSLVALAEPQFSRLGTVQRRSRLLRGRGGYVRGIRYETMHLRDILKPGIKIGAGSFNQDAWAPPSTCRSRWNASLRRRSAVSVSISRRWRTRSGHARSPSAFATSTRRSRARKEFLHTEGRKIVNPYGLVVGDVRASKLAKSRAKSVLDASWAGFGRTLSYKAMTRGACV